MNFHTLNNKVPASMPLGENQAFVKGSQLQFEQQASAEPSTGINISESIFH